MTTIRTLIVFVSCSFFVSWGQVGHKTIGLIAERHLNSKAKQSVQNLIGEASLSDVANWADEVRGSGEYRSTAPWHFINLPIGLSKTDFAKTVLDMSQPNIYNALIGEEQKLSNASSTKDEKIEALKFIIHLIGDAHQPMHVSRAEDKGGNTIQVNYEGRGTNLHALWDSRLLEHESSSEVDLANKIDKVSQQQVVQWQKDQLIDWLWESYQVSSSLYREVGAMSKRTITDQFYQAHISLLEERLEKAGVRLAGVLNDIFTKAPVKNGVQANTSNLKQQVQRNTDGNISLSDISNHIGESVKVCGKVYGEKSFSGMTLVNVGADYPNQLLTIVLKGEARQMWTQGYTGNICVKGSVVKYRGKPEIVVNSPGDFTK